MKQGFVAAAIAATLAALSADAQQAAAASVTANPQRVCLDSRSAYLNFDLRISNPGEKEVAINEIRAFVTTPAGEVTERRILWQQALSLLEDDQKVAGGDVATIFNPFTFSTVKAGSQIRYEVDIAGQSDPVTTIVKPVSCVPPHAYVFPVRERVLVYDGYDFLSHHRRTRYDGMMKELGATDNFQRYGVDLVVVDKTGRFFNGTGKKNSDWFGWGKPVLAAAAGVVAATHNDQPDNEEVGSVDRWTDRSPKTNPMTSYGNYVLIDHGSGEFTVVGHLKQGSVRVQKGDRIAAGQVIGAMGNSGASGGIHTHFERRTGAGIAGIETLPPYFTDVQIIGAGEVAKRSRPVAIDTGDVLVVSGSR